MRKNKSGVSHLTILTWKNLYFTEFSTKNHWNTRLAASDDCHGFTHDNHVFSSFNSIIVQPSQHFNVGSTLFQRWINVVWTLWINIGITFIRRWKWNKIRRRIFNVAHCWYNVGVRHWNNVETTLIQLYLDVASACTQL